MTNKTAFFNQEKTMNYAALGEYHAHKTQANDAANRRFALLHNLGSQLLRAAGQTVKATDMGAIKEQLAEIAAAEREFHAAIERANQAAPLCGEPDLSPLQFGR